MLLTCPLRRRWGNPPEVEPASAPIAGKHGVDWFNPSVAHQHHYSSQAVSMPSDLRRARYMPNP